MLGKVAPKHPQTFYTAQTDRAWVVMLTKTGLVPRQQAAKVLAALEGAEAGGEDALKKRLKGDEDLASVVNYGRTLQEPMSRMLLRDHQLDVFAQLLKAMEATLDVAERHAETIMPGCTHMAHAQPTTYGAYLLASYDGLARGLEQLELAYKHTNENTRRLRRRLRHRLAGGPADGHRTVGLRHADGADLRVRRRAGLRPDHDVRPRQHHDRAQPHRDGSRHLGDGRLRPDHACRAGCWASVRSCRRRRIPGARSSAIRTHAAKVIGHMNDRRGSLAKASR